MSHSEVMRELAKIFAKKDLVKIAADSESEQNSVEDNTELKTEMVSMASVLGNIVSTLVKLADDLDGVGYEDASNAVDAALSVIVQSIEKNAQEPLGDIEPDVVFEEDRVMPKEELVVDEDEIDVAPEGFVNYPGSEDERFEELLRDPEVKRVIRMLNDRIG